MGYLKLAHMIRKQQIGKIITSHLWVGLQLYQDWFLESQIIYIVSPLDFCPGPVDDIIVLLLALAGNKGVDAIEG